MKDEFRLNERQGDGATLRHHLEQVYKQTGKRPEQFTEVECPEEMRYLWQWFCELSGTRQYSEVGAMPITFQEMDAWARLSGNEPSPLDVKVLKQIDFIALQPKAKGGKKNVS